MSRAALALLCLLPGILAWPQQAPLFEAHRYGPEDGLSNRHVTALMQDDIGFIWVGTVSGLDRFDGHAFRSWSLSDGLSSGWVDALRRDAEGRIWVFSNDAANDVRTIDVVQPFSGCVSPLAGALADLPFDVSQVVRVGPQQADGTILLGARSPARCMVHGRSGRWRVIALEGERFEPLGADRTGGVIGHLVGSGGEQRIVQTDSAGAWRVLRELRSGSVVEPLITGRTTPGALYRIKEPASEPRYFDTYSDLDIGGPERPDPLAGLTGDPVRKPLNLTPLPRNGLRVEDTRILDDAGRTVFDLTAIRSEVGGRVKDCLVDRAGDPWMATEFGLFHVEVRGDAFERLLHTEHIPDGFGILCRGMAWHGGRLHLSTEWDGAFALKDGNGTWEVEKRPFPQYLFATHVAADGTWWRGGPNMVVRERPDGDMRTFEVPDKIWSVLPVSADQVLLGGLEGIHRLDPSTGRVLRWSDPAHPELDKAHVLQLAWHGTSAVMALTSKGVYRIGMDGTVLERFSTRADPPRRLPYEALHHCHADADGVLWLSTRGAGLVRFDPATGAHQQYTMRNGFPNNTVYAAYEDAHGQLWLPTDGGLVRFDKRTRQSTVFTVGDGIAHDEFNRLAHTRAPDGRLFFGGLNGITVVDPDRFLNTMDRRQGPLVITSVMRYSAEHQGMVDRTADLHPDARIELGPDDRAIHVSFALLSFQGTSRTLYAWRMEGVEDDWNYQQAPTIRLDRLPHGDHVLEVKARNATGQWSDHVLTLPIRVPTPWHASRAAWLCFGALGAVLVGAPIALRRGRSSGRRGPSHEA